MYYMSKLPTLSKKNYKKVAISAVLLSSLILAIFSFSFLNDGYNAKANSYPHNVFITNSNLSTALADCSSPDTSNPDPNIGGTYNCDFYLIKNLNNFDTPNYVFPEEGIIFSATTAISGSTPNPNISAVTCTNMDGGDLSRNSLVRCSDIPAGNQSGVKNVLLRANSGPIFIKGTVNVGNYVDNTNMSTALQTGSCSGVIYTHNTYNCNFPLNEGYDFNTSARIEASTSATEDGNQSISGRPSSATCEYHNRVLSCNNIPAGQQAGNRYVLLSSNRGFNRNSRIRHIPITISSTFINNENITSALEGCDITSAVQSGQTYTCRFALKEGYRFPSPGSDSVIQATTSTLGGSSNPVENTPTTCLYTPSATQGNLVCNNIPVGTHITTHATAGQSANTTRSILLRRGGDNDYKVKQAISVIREYSSNNNQNQTSQSSNDTNNESGSSSSNTANNQSESNQNFSNSLLTTSVEFRYNRETNRFERIDSQLQREARFCPRTNTGEAFNRTCRRVLTEAGERTVYAHNVRYYVPSVQNPSQGILYTQTLYTYNNGNGFLEWFAFDEQGNRLNINNLTYFATNFN